MIWFAPGGAGGDTPDGVGGGIGAVLAGGAGAGAVDGAMGLPRCGGGGGSAMVAFAGKAGTGVAFIAGAGALLKGDTAVSVEATPGCRRMDGSGDVAGCTTTSGEKVTLRLGGGVATFSGSTAGVGSTGAAAGGVGSAAGGVGAGAGGVGSAAGSAGMIKFGFVDHINHKINSSSSSSAPNSGRQSSSPGPTGDGPNNSYLLHSSNSGNLGSRLQASMRFVISPASSLATTQRW